MQADDEFQCQSKGFMSWLRKQEGVKINPDIDLADLRAQGAGRGVVALQDIKEGEELFSIPHCLIMTVQNSDLQKHIPQELEPLDPWLRMVLVLIYETGLVDSSRWWPYCQVLPEQFNTLVYWSGPELAELHGSAVLGKVGKEKANESFKVSLLPIVTKHSSTFGRYSQSFQSPDAQDVLLALAHSMATIIMAYAFDLDTENLNPVDEEGFVPDDDDAPPKGMVPLADMLNANANNNAHLQDTPEGLVMTAVKPIQKGSEILNDYGPLPRSDLLRRYGYITDEYKQYDVVELATSKIFESISSRHGLSANDLRLRQHGPLNKLRKQIFQIDELYDDPDHFEDTFDLPQDVSNSSLEFFGPEWIMMIKSLIPDDHDLVHMQAHSVIPQPTMDSQVIEVLRDVLLGRQKDYATTIAEDVQYLKSTNLPVRRRQAIEVRHGEKQILASALEYLQRGMRSLIADGEEVKLNGKMTEYDERDHKKQKT